MRKDSSTSRTQEEAPHRSILAFFSSLVLEFFVLDVAHELFGDPSRLRRRHLACATLRADTLSKPSSLCLMSNIFYPECGLFSFPEQVGTLLPNLKPTGFFRRNALYTAAQRLQSGTPLSH